MIVRTKSSVSGFVLAILLFGFGSYVCAETHTATSCSYQDVSAAVTSATSGDTVIVPAGAATWATTLTIAKAVALLGAGIGKTVISGDIVYEMPNPSSFSLFRLSGFTLNPGCLTVNNKSRYFTARIRIDHNSLTSAGTTLRINGNVYGVIDNNIFNTGDCWYVMGANADSWGYVTFAPGTAEALYIEDNEINYSSASHSLFQDSGAGAVFVLRFNSYTFSCTNTSNAYWWDMHGNQSSSSNHSTIGAEIYGNRLVSTTAKVLQIIDQRGGSALVYWNKAASGITYASYQTREECDDCLNGHIPCSGPDGQPMHVSESYYWNNRYGSTLVANHTVTNSTGVGCVAPTHEIALGVDVFTDNGSGVASGPLSSRPLTCTPGDAYWATDQVCTLVQDENVGKSPSAPISGTLYVCTAPNTWTEYYRPYIYPHPLRQPEAATSPEPPSGLRIAP